jgi:hypothetical protein
MADTKIADHRMSMRILSWTNSSKRGPMISIAMIKMSRFRNLALKQT